MFRRSFPLLLLVSLSAVGQTPTMRFDHISIEQGLSDLTVFSFAQDSSGFLWFGTSDGLNKYDGYTFTIFRNDPSDSTTMPSGSVNSLCVDRSGVLWLASSSGLSIFHPDSSRPYRVSNQTVYGSTVSKGVRWLDVLNNGDIGIATDGGFYVYSWSARTFSQLQIDTLVNADIHAFAQTREGTFWFGVARRGLISLDPTSGAVRHFMPYKLEKPALLDNSINRIKQDRRGWIWVAASNGLYRLDTASQSFVRYTDQQGLAVDLMPDILEDRHGTIWVGTFHIGVGRYRPETDDFVRIDHDPEDPQSLTSSRLTRMFEDRGGVLWFANYRAGLNRLNAKRSSFTHYVTRKTAGMGLSTDGVYAILEDSRGEVWFGTYTGGLNRYDPVRGKFRYYQPVGSGRYSLNSNSVLAIAESPEGDLWIGGGGGLDRLERHTGRFIHYPMVNEKERLGSEREVKSILLGSDGFVWFGTFTGGLHRLNPETGEARHYKHLGGDSLSTGSPGVWALCEDNRGRLWLGTYGAGVFVMDRRTETFRRFLPDEKKPMTSLSTTGIYHILKDKDGILWIGTMGGGLNRLDPETEVFTHYTVKDGLPNNFVKGIREDARGHLWLSTDLGISRFDPRTGTFKNFTVQDGLMGNVFLSGAHFAGRKGRMYFGGENGAVSFHPDSIRENMFVPPIVITSVRVLDQVFPAKPLALDYDRNSVEFEFVALDFTLPEKNRYAYRIDEINPDWVQAGTRRYASYHHLDPGTYTFRVKGSNNDGVWNETGAFLTFTIAPPFWETWWFRIAVFLVVAGMATWFYNYRVRRLLEIERLRVKIASDLHDDIGSSLTRISLQSELIQEGIEPAEMNTYLKNIASQSRELVTTMSDIVWSLDARNDTAGDLVNKIRDFSTTTLNVKQIDLSLSASGLDLKKKIPVDVRENIYLICKEAVNNIARHSGASHASIELKNEPTGFRMVIADNGAGVREKNRTSGHGLRNMRMRAERVGGKMEFAEVNGFTVVFKGKPL